MVGEWGERGKEEYVSESLGGIFKRCPLFFLFPRWDSELQTGQPSLWCPVETGRLSSRRYNSITICAADYSVVSWERVGGSEESQNQSMLELGRNNIKVWIVTVSKRHIVHPRHLFLKGWHFYSTKTFLFITKITRMLMVAESGRSPPPTSLLCEQAPLPHSPCDSG